MPCHSQSYHQCTHDSSLCYKYYKNERHYQFVDIHCNNDSQDLSQYCQEELSDIIKVSLTPKQNRQTMFNSWLGLYKHQDRDDYNGLTSDIFQTIQLNVRPLMHHLSNAMYGCLIKLRDHMAMNGFCPIISENL